MSPLDRHFSSSSVATTASETSSGAFDIDDSVSTVPESPTSCDSPLPCLAPSAEVTTRKRPTPTQLNALQTAFDAKPYLSREERVALAASTGMELKSVTAWFQNRRQATRRARASKAARDATEAADRRRALGRAVSLDDFASRTERRRVCSTPVSASTSFVFPEHPSSSTPPMPVTPCRPRVVRAISTTPSKSGDNIWQRIPSSPAAPLSSPAAEKDRFLALPEQASSRRSLEYACANARAGPARAVKARHPDVMEEDDMLGSSKYQPLQMELPGMDWADARNKENIEGTIRRLNMDVEAAMVLLGFQKQSP